jgi:hypothetical protein
MKKVLGAVCMVIGIALLIGALSLFLWNRAEADRAEESSAVAVQLLQILHPMGDNIYANTGNAAHLLQIAEGASLHLVYRHTGLVQLCEFFKKLIIEMIHNGLR